ncbi:short-chain dehydrogenase [Metarhizobium album]|uniref:Short-chain dehydrogenase n=1 Tax=Metarhizobium album TaxID=2182425 RepID=A0A2U2DUI5_9HYPH|nr:SDR family oxidoreductase [Rhizobium album]PWE56964.1 short-chain dehydrogenase [Rhizobium album]
MYTSLKDKLAVVTGGASGIGLACVLQLVRAGAGVISIDRDRNTSHEFPSAAEQVQIDVCDEAVIKTFAEKLRSNRKHVDYLVNCAGIVQSPLPPDELSAELFKRVVAVDLEGTFNSCAAFGSDMALRGTGSIVNIASVAGMRSMPLHAYSPAKAGVISLTECLAAEWGRSGVRVNTISPGYTLTAALRSQIELGNRDPRQLKENSCLGVIIEPDDIANAVLFLLSDYASMITGANLPVDAGWLAAGSWQTFGGVRAVRELAPDLT